MCAEKEEEELQINAKEAQQEAGTHGGDISGPAPKSPRRKEQHDSISKQQPLREQPSIRRQESDRLKADIYQRVCSAGRVERKRLEAIGALIRKDPACSLLCFTDQLAQESTLLLCRACLCFCCCLINARINSANIAEEKAPLNV